ncbi:MAG TPA: TonB-dependent receptor plug domain-containing protein, partial [Chthoniobacterales bacterium]
MPFRSQRLLLLLLAASTPLVVQPVAAQQSVTTRITRRGVPKQRRNEVTVQLPQHIAADAAYTIAQVAGSTTAGGSAAELERVVVRGFDIYPVEYPALPDVEGTRINAGKKTSFVKPEEFPVVTNNNYREVVSTIPGVLVSEEPSSPIINIGYRGFDTQRAEFTQVLKDGISVKNEQFGFPETHYTPILDSIERIEFIRGGSALQYGPQPGGAINFITKMPRRDAPFHIETKNAWGTDEFYQNYTAIDGTFGNFG